MSAIFGHLVVVFFCYIVVIVVLASSSKKNQSFSRVRSIQHDDKCFTQGLFIHDGKIIESCGLNGKSSIRIVHAHNGSVIKEKRLQHKYFAEGLAVVNNTIYVLTWRNKEIIVLDLHTLEIQESRPFYTYTGEGWGLTYNGEHLIASDGSSRLSFLQIPPLGSNGVFKNVKEVHVYDPNSRGNKPIKNINELEYLDGVIYANIWYEDHIHQIDAYSGKVMATFDMSTLYPKQQRSANADCLNGIAFNSSDRTFLLTGKLWPHYHVVRFDSEGGGGSSSSSSSSSGAVRSNRRRDELK